MGDKNGGSIIKWSHSIKYYNVRKENNNNNNKKTQKTR